MTFDPRTIGALPTAQAGGRPAPMAPMPTSRYVLPQYEERTAYGFKRQDPYTKLFEDRIIFLGVQVDDASADDVMAQLLVLESQDPDRDHWFTAAEALEYGFIDKIVTGSGDVTGGGGTDD